MKKTYCKPATSRNEKLTGIVPLVAGIAAFFAVSQTAAGLALGTVAGAAAGAGAAVGAKALAGGRYDFSRWERLPILNERNALC